MEYVVEPGTIELMIGTSSEAIHLQTEIELVGNAQEISKQKIFFSEVMIA
jgi:beta-glucosidase